MNDLAVVTVDGWIRERKRVREEINKDKVKFCHSNSEKPQSPKGPRALRLWGDGWEANRLSTDPRPLPFQG